MKASFKSRAKQQGVALFITLLVVTIATLLATEIWFNNTLDIARQYNNRAAYQANHYTKGMVLWAIDVLRQDFEAEPAFDNHTQAWNQPIAGIELDDAMLSGKLTDLDSKFNLNNLVIRNQVNEVNLAYFKRILSNLELDVGIADKIIDWMDTNQIPRPLGAEDVVYLSKSPSYRTAGQYFQHISELRLIDGVNQRTYVRLKSFVTVLPIQADKPTKVNINTASALLLLSLDDRITSDEALVLFSDGSASNKTLDDFFRQPAIQIYHLGNDDMRMKTELISTKNIWYQARVTVKMEQSIFQKYALLNRNASTTIVRSWSETPYN